MSVDPDALQALAARPYDTDALRVYADWLEDHGELVRAELVRLTATLHGELDPKARRRFEKLRAGVEDGRWLARVGACDRFTMLWPAERCADYVQSREPLRLISGGGNQGSRFSGMNVRTGDFIYPVRMYQKRVYLIARMRVDQVLTREELYAATSDRAPLRWGGEVLVGEGTPVNLDRVIPLEIVAQLKFRSATQERTLTGSDGIVKKTTGLHGIFRLAPHSARRLDTLLTAPDS